MVTTFHHPTQQVYSTGMHEVEGKELYYMGIDFLVRKLDPLKVKSQKEMAKLQTTNEKIEFLTFSFQPTVTITMPKEKKGHIIPHICVPITNPR